MNSAAPRRDLSHAAAVGAVDYNDDSKRRFVLRRYAYDPARRQRRHIIVAVVDNQREYKRVFGLLSDELRSRRAAGEQVDPREHISGHVMEPGHLARAANGHLLRRATEHGAWTDRLQGLKLPGNMAVFREATSRGGHSDLWSWLRNGVRHPRRL